MVFLSIVLPCYRVEKQINRCITSLYNQDISEFEYELIVVNDCSPDKTMEIVDGFKIQHKNIISINHEINKGLGAARNTGLKNAQGKYVWFIDSDDYVAENCFRYIINQLETNNLDILSFNFYKQLENGQFVGDFANKNNNLELLTGFQYMELNFQPSTFSSCSKIFRLEYLLDHLFFFPEGVFWEDADFVMRAIYKSTRIKFVQDHLYYYCFNQQSISHESISGKNYADLVKMGARKLAFSNAIAKESPMIAEKIRMDSCWNATTVKKIVFLNAKERKVFYANIENIKYQEIKTLQELGKLRYLYLYPNFVHSIFFLLSPMMNILKRLKYRNK